MGERLQKKLFVVGCPRSGTTWIQLLLSQHSRVATAPETQIFAYYLIHFVNQWRHEHETPHREGNGLAGLSRLLSEEEFVDLCRLSADAVLDKIAARNPAATVVVEKSPKHALMADFIQQVFPDAYFLHVIRDPRDTAASLLAAGRSWGSGWAPKNVIDAARMWLDHVHGGRRISDTARYREVRYEALREAPIAGLRDIVEWLGIPESIETCEGMVQACDLAKLQEGTSGKTMPIPSEKSPKNFFRKGSVGGWRDDLSAADVRIIEYLCADMMAQCGYETAGKVGRPLRIRLHDAIQRIRESADWQFQKLLYRV